MDGFIIPETGAFDKKQEIYASSGEDGFARRARRVVY
jgi:hypothetical protein